MRSDFGVSSRNLVLFSCSAVGYLLIHFLLDGRIQLGDFLLAPSVGVAVPLGVLFGLPASLGVALGVVFTHLIESAISLVTLFDAFSLFVLAYSSFLLTEYNALLIPFRRSLKERNFWLQKAVAGLFAILLATSFRAWSYELLGLFSFYISVVTEFLNIALSTAIVSLFVLPLVRRTRLRKYVSDGNRLPKIFLSRTSRLMITLSPVLWAILGFVGSLGFRLREGIFRTGLESRNVGFLYDWVHPDTFGHGGRRAQVVLGVIVIVSLLLLVKTAIDRPGGST